MDVRFTIKDCLQRVQSTENTGAKSFNDDWTSLLKLNKAKMIKVFRTHAWNKIDGVYCMSMEETLKMLKNLRLFPDMITFYELKQVLCRNPSNFDNKFNEKDFDKEDQIIQARPDMSPSAAQTGVGEGNKISANKNNLTFNDFEALLNYIWKKVCLEENSETTTRI